MHLGRHAEAEEQFLRVASPSMDRYHVDALLAIVTGCQGRREDAARHWNAAFGKIGERIDRARERAAGVDVALVWELAADSDGAVGLDALASLALDENDGAARTALVIAFLEDGVRFVRNDVPTHDLTGGGYWVPDLIAYQNDQGTLRFGSLDADQRLDKGQPALSRGLQKPARIVVSTTSFGGPMT